MSGRRYLVLHLPRLATDRIRHGEPDLAGQMLATWATHGNRRLLIGVDAPGTSLLAGRALADAQAMYPALVLRPADVDADTAFLERLALWAVRFTPLTAVDPPDGLVLDVTGCADLFDGEAALLARVSDTLTRGGVTNVAVIASVADVAALLARADQHGRIVPPGGEAAAVAGLPLELLRLPPECVAGLNRLGLQRVGDVLRQPRAPLMRRFGRTLLDVLDAITGDRPRALPPVRAPADFMEAVNFLEPIVTRPAIDMAVDAMLEPLCRRLGEAGQGARAVTLRAFRVDREVQEITIGTGLPTRAPAHLRRLFANELERLEPDLGFERMTLEASITNAMAEAQDVMAVVTGAQAGNAEALAQLLDRLSQRLPVWRLAQGESHWPERQAVRVGAFAPVTPGHVAPGPATPAPVTPALGCADVSAPVRLLQRPIPVMVVATVPDGPPAQVRHDGVVQQVVWADGPERIEREWWQDTTDRTGRDYYRVQLASGIRLWMGRVAALRPDRPPRWFLHGYLA